MAIASRKSVKKSEEVAEVLVSVAEPIAEVISNPKIIPVKALQGMSLGMLKARKLSTDISIDPNDFKSFISNFRLINRKIWVSMSVNAENKVDVLVFNTNEVGVLIEKDYLLGYIYLN